MRWPMPGISPGASGPRPCRATSTPPTPVPTASDYYERWVAALEELLTARGVADDAAVTELTALWQAAARATPHGHPIDLANAQRD